ncbi:MAG TPA: gamma-glutamyltransferase [Candidatus Acidoferrales bacterium]|jgi:gamma-glutamyltranspeptidase/glutathione hydrolase|nr:gamma-glutamyltransferase [Candidatus Acidoferrales bacterium]
MNLLHRRALVARLFRAAFLLFFAFFACAAAQAQAQQPREFSGAGAVAHPQWPSKAVRAPKAMVVSDEALASKAGVEILKKGGNAVDAAVAVAFALAVVEPEAGNIGGGGFMLVRLADGRAGFVDYREEAPQKATREMYLRADGSVDPKASTAGCRAIAVPGTVAGLDLALRTYGTMKVAAVMAPAIRLAEQGFPVSRRLAALLHESAKALERFSASRRIFLKDGAFYRPGEILRQPELAATLRRIARNGAAEFYRGATARGLVDEMARLGGLITLDDLARYQPKLREPLRATYEAHGAHWELITSPPPSSGGIATIEALNILAPVALKGWEDAASVHWVAEAMRRAFADRAAYLGDSDFAYVPVRGLTDPRYAAVLRATIDPARATPSSETGAGNPAPFDGAGDGAAASGGADGAVGEEMSREAAIALAESEARRGGHTTHFSVVDAAGNAVANTYTLNDDFGSGVATSTGFLLNDEMDDFTSKPGVPNMFGLIQSEANAIGPGKRPLSSMMPTILVRDGKLSFVTGSPGGPRIISATLLTILNWMRLGMDAQAAINAPRFHHQWMPDRLVIEDTLSDGVARELEQRGYRIFIDPKEPWVGEVEAIGIDPATGERLGAPDARREGVALGY